MTDFSLVPRLQKILKIGSICSMSDFVKAKKQLGQHFLNDQVIADNIVDALLSYPIPNAILEVGPGTGVLTSRLLSNGSGKEIWASEIDKESIAYLQKHFPQLENRLLDKSFLDLNFKDYFPNEFAVIGNFPYNISSQIVFKVLDNYTQIPVLVGMFQKEVAERIAAKPGNGDYGIITVLSQLYYSTEYLFTVPETVFIPPPKVKSGVIRMTRNENLPDVNIALLKKVVKTGFNQRRKKLRNAIAVFGLNDDSLGRFASARAEELSLNDFCELTNLVELSGYGKNSD